MIKAMPPTCRGIRLWNPSAAFTGWRRDKRCSCIECLYRHAKVKNGKLYRKLIH